MKIRNFWDTAPGTRRTGKDLQAAREGHHLTQKDMASRLYTTCAEIDRLEKRGGLGFYTYEAEKYLIKVHCFGSHRLKSLGFKSFKIGADIWWYKEYFSDMLFFSPEEYPLTVCLRAIAKNTLDNIKNYASRSGDSQPYFDKEMITGYIFGRHYKRDTTHLNQKVDDLPKGAYEEPDCLP